MTNPQCIDCKKERNLNDRCICNNEIRCGSCKNCSWCIDVKQNGKCVPNRKYNFVKCPYSFNNKWRKPIYDSGSKNTVYYESNDLSIYKYIYLSILILLILIILTYFMFKKINRC